jgi:PKD repeat protein
MSKKITALNPKAEFFSTDLAACAPSVVSFSNLSVDADNYSWDFGDSTTSTNQHPSHIYNTPGIFDVTLIASSIYGCADTFKIDQYIKALGPITNFTASSLSGCSPLEVTFTDHSQNASAYTWNFGDGYEDFTINATHTYVDSGSFTVSLVTADTAGCISFYELPQQVVVLDSPESSFTASGTSGCQPLITTFTNTSANYAHLTWFFDDGNTTSVSNPVHQYDNPGIYNAQLVTYNAAGCSDTTSLTQPIEVFAVPLPQFSTSGATGCAPFHVTFTDQSANLSGPHYLWDFGNGFTSTDPNPSFDFNPPGPYIVSVTVTNNGGCSASATFPAAIIVSDTVPPNETKIYSVSVVSDTSVKIIWENNPAIDLAAYVVYRLDPLTNQFSIAYTETNVQNTNFSLTSEYTDTGLNTLLYSYTYKVQAIDTCGTTIPLDSLDAHTTINISSLAFNEDIYVNWSAYGGCPVSGYQLYRAAPGETFNYVTTVSGNITSYLDTGFTCPLPYAYKVMATDLCGNTYTSFSDTSVTHPLNTLDNQVVDIVRSTVYENSSVLTEWAQPQIHPELVAQFDIYRSTDNINFSYVESVPSVQTDFMDYNVDVQNEHYYYKILVINTCDIAEDLSDISSTIILKGEIDELRMTHLTWTPYEGWDQGVEYYILEHKDENGHWQFLRQVNGNILNYEHQE